MRFVNISLVRKHVELWLFSIVITLLYGVFFIFSEFYGMPYSGLDDFSVLVFQFMVIEFATLGLICLLSISRYIFAAVFPLMTVACTAVTYFRYTAQVTLTPMVIDLAIVNDFNTSMDVVTWQLVALCVLSLAVSVFAVRYRFRRVNVSHAWAHAAIAAFILFLPFRLGASNMAVRGRMPFSLYTSVSDYLDYRRDVSAERTPFKGRAVCGSDSLTVVFVLGESVRASNLQINGYHRATTPLLCREKNVVSIPDVYTDYIYTHTSVPHIMTRYDAEDPDKAYSERSFVSLLKQAGYRTAWLANQESVSTFVYFMEECDTLVYVNGGKSLYVFDKWLDEDLLPAYEEELRRDEGRKFILLHTIGSHWWYNSHYPQRYEVYKPVVRSRVISANNKEEMRNSYDNTILYSDYVWHRLISSLRGRNAVLVYLSDHAECLGEDGYFTHGTDRPQLHHPACFVWYSDEFARRYPDKVKALRANRDRRWKSYFLFHSILDAADVRSRYVDDSLNIFRTQR